MKLQGTAWLVFLVIVVLSAGLLLGCSNGSTGGDGGGGGGGGGGGSSGGGGGSGDDDDGGGGDPPVNFTDTVNANKIFGASLPYLTAATDTSTGANVIALMEERFVNAYTINDGEKFYSIMDGLSDTVNGITFKYDNIYGADPMVSFLIDVNNLRIFGSSTGGNAVTKTITFDVAVIHKTTGKGWLIENQTRSFIWYTGNSITREEVSSIALSAVNDWTEYNVYIIVRQTSTRSSFGDFNSCLTNNLCTRNVIQVYPRPYTLP